MPTQISEKDFLQIAGIVKSRAGISLNQDKKPMVEARLVKRLNACQVNSYKDYLRIIESDEKEMLCFINVMTTNKTSFFREDEHFKYLRQELLPKFLGANKNNRLMAWSAASSTGEEAYTLAITIEEFFGKFPAPIPLDYKILGTDINTEVVNKAENGIYSEEIVTEIPWEILRKYFLRGTGPKRGFYRIDPQIKQKVKFRRKNLLEEMDFTSELKFDFVFLRNVLIYFDSHTIEVVINQIFRKMNPGGVLFIGHSENLLGVTHPFHNIKPTIYLKE